MKSIKKILIVGKNPPPYFGTSVWFETLKNASWDKDLEVTFFNNNINKELNSLGKFSLKKIIQNLKLYYSFFKFTKIQKPNLILIPISQTTLGFLKDSFFIFIAKKQTKVLLILHGADFLCWSTSVSYFTKKHINKTFKNTIGVVVLGEKLKSLFNSYFSKEQIFSIPNGLTINYNFLSPKNKEKRADKLKIVYLGNLQKSKGIKNIIDALALIDNTKIEFNVIGQWREKKTKNYCLKKKKELNLNINFIGPKYGNEKLEFLKNSEVFIFTPIKPEGHPLVLIEAMAFGLPIISTNQGAISESVLENENGFIIEENSPKLIASKIKFFIDNENIRLKMASKSKEIYLKNYTAEIMVQNYSDLFKKLI